jgi:3-hydroxybutyryl-CoA dehydrogenase
MRPPTDLRVAVLGTGRTGAAIAAEYLTAGYRVRVTASQNTSPVTAIRRVLSQLPSGDRATALSWHPDPQDAARGADVVIESLPELLPIKREQLAAAQQVAPRALLATNTSSFRIEAVAAGLGDPARLVGTHYLNPPPAFPVVEVIPGPRTARRVVTAVCGLLASLGKAPVVLRRDVPGQVINRLQFALLREAEWLVRDGVVSRRQLDVLVRDGLARRWSAADPFAIVALGGPELFARVAERLYPLLSTDREPAGVLASVPAAPRTVRELARARDRRLAIWSPGAHENCGTDTAREGTAARQAAAAARAWTRS